MTNNNGNNKGGIGAIIFICLVIIFDVAYIVDYNIDRAERKKQEEEEQRKRKEAAKKANERAWSKGEPKGKDMSYLNLIPSSSASNGSSSKSNSSKSKSYKYDPYDVYDYDDALDFADEWEEEFDDWEEAYEYWEDSH